MSKNIYYHQNVPYIKARGFHTLRPFNGELFQSSCAYNQVDPHTFCSTIEEAPCFVWDSLKSDAILYKRVTARGKLREEPKPIGRDAHKCVHSLNVNCYELFPFKKVGHPNKALGFGITSRNLLEATRTYYDENPLNGEQEELPLNMGTTVTDFFGDKENAVEKIKSELTEPQNLLNRIKEVECQNSKLKRFAFSVPSEYHTTELYDAFSKEELIAMLVDSTHVG